MADAPRDPRQLARDILAGRVKIEDLAKERQGSGGQRPASHVPDRVPLPRPVPPPAQPARPQMRPQPALERPAQRPSQRPQVKAKPLQPKPVLTVAPPVQRPGSTTPQAAQTAAQAYAGATTATIAATMESALGVQISKKKHPGAGLAQFMRSRNSIRQAIILSEVLNKPISMRENR